MEISELLKNYLNYSCYFATMGVMRVQNNSCEISSGSLARQILKEIQLVSIDALINFVVVESDKLINASNVPQFSRLEVGALDLPSLLKETSDYGMTYTDIGKKILGEGKKEAAYQKYGENHAKLAKELDLVYIINQSQAYVYLTELGYALLEYDEWERKEIVAKLMTSIPIIRYILKLGKEKKVEIVEILLNYMSSSTAKRRKSSINNIIKYLKGYSEEYNFLWENIV